MAVITDITAFRNRTTPTMVAAGRLSADTD
jgi:hypothetical protein